MYNKEQAKAAEQLLRIYGVGNEYKGFHFCLYCVALALKTPDDLQYVTKRIYPEVARRFKTSRECVERDIRTVAEVVWKNGGGELLCREKWKPDMKRPTNSQFLQLLVYSVSRKPLSQESLLSDADADPGHGGHTGEHARPSLQGGSGQQVQTTCGQGEAARGHYVVIADLYREKIARLEHENAKLELLNTELEKENAKLREEIRELKHTK